jgi:hypothetical protein
LVRHEAAMICHASKSEAAIGSNFGERRSAM